ncbi:mechanosensitive ion channel family protein [Myxococcota bacterium]|nr:mechanosensitive ion channel family protein [Myxococcota bacterium]
MWLDQTGPGLVTTVVAIVAVTAARRALPKEHRSRGRTATFLLLLSIVAKAGALVAARLHAKQVAVALDFADDLALGLGLAGTFDILLFDTVLERLRVHAPRIVRDLLQAAAFFGILMGLLGAHGVDLLALATTSAIVTAVVGLALQGTIANLFAGLAMQVDRSFAIGDWIRVGDRTGRIRQIKWRSTAIETVDGDVWIVPNAQLVTHEVLNHSAPSKAHRERTLLTFHYRHAPNDVKRIVLDAIRGVPGVLTSPAPNVVPKDFGDYGVTYVLLYWVDDMARELEIDGEVKTRIWYAARRAALEIPYPIHDVNVRTMPAADVGARPEQAERLSLLGRVELFAPLHPSDRELLAERMHEQRFAAGEKLIVQGEAGASVFLVRSGAVDVHVEKGGVDRIVATVGPGELVGEMSLMTGAPRAATCTARADVVAYEIDQRAFRVLLEARPELVDELSRVLAARALVLSAERDNLSAELAAARVAESSLDLGRRVRAFFGLDG